MTAKTPKPLRCAIYTRKSTEHGLDLEFNSLGAQREACEAYIKSQASQGWRVMPAPYDDAAFSGANLERPALQALLADIAAGKIDVVVVYKIDRLTSSLTDFAKLVELFDARSVSFVAVSSTDEGKAAAPYEFGVKASILAAGGLFVLHARAMLDNPYDGHTSGTSLTAPRN